MGLVETETLTMSPSSYSEEEDHSSGQAPTVVRVLKDGEDVGPMEPEQ
jgi:hypothetical protein